MDRETLTGPGGLQVLLEIGKAPRVRLGAETFTLIEALFYQYTAGGQEITADQKAWLYAQESRIVTFLYQVPDEGFGADARGAAVPE